MALLLLVTGCMNQNGINMTVVELMEKLQNMPLDAKIMCDGGLQGPWFPRTIEVKKERRESFMDPDEFYYVVLK